MTDVVNVGTTDNDGNGDTLRAAFSQINTRFNELLSTIDGGDAWATGVTYTATPIRQWVINAGQAYVAAVNHVSGASFAADLSAGKWFAVDSAQILADLAAPPGAGLIGYTPTGLLTATTVEGALNEVRDASNVSYTPAGAGAVATNVENKLRITASDADAVTKQSTQPAYAAVAVNFTRTTIDRHAFEDWSTLATTDTGQGYCSFDAKATLTNSLVQDHLVGYQSRNVYNGSAALSGYMHGYDTDMYHTGTGTIAKVRGIFIKDIGGTGPVTEDIGLVIDPITRGTSNAAIFSGPGNYHYFGGTTGTIDTGVIKAIALNYAVDTPGKSITYGYGTAGLTNFGQHIFYNGKDTVLATLDTANGLAIATSIQSTYTIKPGSVAYSALPAASDGAMLYCSDGRKVGESTGDGTGVPVYYSAGAWRVFSTDAVVTV